MNNSRRALLISIGLTVTLYALPYAVPQATVLAWPLVLLSTLAHELGHGLAALLAGCHFEQLVIYGDASGVARWSGSPGRLARAFISAGGLIGPAVVAGGLFAAARSPRVARHAAGVLGIGLLAVDLLFVRNLFGLAFVAALSLALLLLWAKASGEIARTTLVFVAVQLALSVFSRGDYLFTAVAKTAEGDMPSDVAHMASALILPYWIWGGFVGLLSVAVLYWGIQIYLGKGK